MLQKKHVPLIRRRGGTRGGDVGGGKNGSDSVSERARCASDVCEDTVRKLEGIVGEQK